MTAFQKSMKTNNKMTRIKTKRRRKSSSRRCSGVWSLNSTITLTGQPELSMKSTGSRNKSNNSITRLIVRYKS